MKSLIWIFMIVGSWIGSLVPSLWGAGMFSLSSVLLSAVGGFAGIYVGYRIAQR